MRASLLLAGILSATTVAAQTPKPEPVTTARMIVTVADHPSHNPVPFKPGDLKIFGATVTGMRALDAGNGVELFLVIDDTANREFGARLAELRRFALS